MAFEQESTKTPSSVGRIRILLTTEPPEYQSAHFDIVIGFDDGSTKTRKGNLVPHITPAQRQGLMDFMAAMRTQAESQILPE